MTRLTSLSVSIVSLFLAAAYAGCSAQGDNGDGDGDAGNGDGDLNVGDGDGDSTINIGDGDGDFTLAAAWPPEPQLGPDAPPGVADLFGGTSIGEACVTEPQTGALIPRNWLRPRFRVHGGASTYMVTLSAEEMGNDLVGYGGPSGWAIPEEFWQGIAQHASSAPVTVTATIRAHNGAGFTESTSTFQIAPVDAGGAMIYWASNQSKDHVDSSALWGFRVGDEASEPVLKPVDVQEGDIRSYDTYSLKGSITSEWSDPTGASPGRVSCIGCHTSTPDGAAVAFNDGFPWAGVTASVEEGSKGVRAIGVSDVGARLLATPAIGTIAFSSSSWETGNRRAIATFNNLTPYNNMNTTLAEANDLVWIDLETPGSADFSAMPDQLFAGFRGTGWDVIQRTGDTRAASNPAWNDAGDLIAYVSTDRVAGGHVGGIAASTTPKQPDTVLGGPTEADIYTVPFNGGAGGTATPLPGAAEPNIAEYYPDFSSDGKLIAFNRAGSTNGYIYYRPDGEVNVIPTTGGAPHRIEANAPPACTGEVSPGVINSWPKWGPSVESAGGKSYYWLIFSSARAYPEQFMVPRDYYTPTSLDTRSSQLYLAAVVVEADGTTITSYPGVYVWNQEVTTSNLTPAWDEFKIPPVPVR